MKEKSPLVHNITNYVTVNDVANALFTCGGSPIMSDEPKDVEDITAICGGLNINIGTLMQTITQTQIEFYKEYLISEEKSEVTIEKYIRDISAFARWLDCAELNKTAVLHYKQQLIESYAPTTVNSVLASLNGFFEFNERYDLKVKNLKV